MSKEIRNEILIKVAHNQSTYYVLKSKKTYYAEKTKSKETEKRKLKIYL